MRCDVRVRLAAATLLAAAALAAAPGAARAADVRAGVGRSDITPPTGYFTFGYVRADSVGLGQHTRLFARAVVLERDGRKVALVGADLGAIPGGLLVEVARRLAARGFSERNILLTGSHSHTAPTGFYNFRTYNTVFMTLRSPTDFNVTGDFDAQLYGFMVDRVARAIERADDALAPARVGWGTAHLEGVTRNRSLDAHLANFGHQLEYGQGRESMAPRGYLGTIDPRADVLRVDRRVRGRWVPAGGWVSFANHGTVNPYDFTVWSGDHTGPASRTFEEGVRRAGRVPPESEVVGAYNSPDGGDQSSGLERRGPAWSHVVGAAEGRAWLTAWRDAGRRLTSQPQLDLRWTRVCYCGQETEGGRVDDTPVVGLPFITGSEENRGPLFDVTHEHYEGRRTAVATGPQSHKVVVFRPPFIDVPRAIPLMAIRVGDRVVVSHPHEMTAALAERVRAAVLPVVAPAGIRRVVIGGYANEFVHYLPTPEEYDRQHYEGGATLYGKYSGNLVKERLVDLAGRLARGQDAPAPHPYDPTNGLAPDTRPFEAGAAAGSIVEPPGDVRRLGRARIAWTGGERGLDRPLDHAFVQVQRRTRGRWRTVADDLGLEVIWRTDGQGRYSAEWEVPLAAWMGTHRLVVSARRYRLESPAFKVRRSLALRLGSVRVAARRTFLTFRYPDNTWRDELTHHPTLVRGGRVKVRRGRTVLNARRRRSATFSLRLPPGRRFVLPPSAVRDRYGNRNGEPLAIEPPG